jgi:2-methylcitrate dehydratase PrpD
MAGDEAGATRTLARFAVATAFEALPAPVVHEAKRALVNWAGCVIGGSGHTTVQRAWSALAPFAGPPQACLLGRATRTDILHAALLNGIASHVLDFDDTHPETLIHPSGPVASAIVALGEYAHASGRELLNAFVAGVEVECRVARGVLPSHNHIGWHITGTAGIFGAATASARLLRLSQDRTVWALGLAATQAAGLREMFGSMAKSLHPGKAAQNGLSSALLAQSDFNTTDTALEGRNGFGQVLSTTADFSRSVADIGVVHELLQNTYKPFACGLVVHPAIDGCIRLRNEAGVQAGEVARVELEVHPLTLHLTGKTHPTSGLEGKFSVYHAAAVALLDGAGGEAQFSDARVLADDAVALRAKVEARVLPDLAMEAANVVITLRNGQRHEVRVQHCVGSREQPMSDGQLEDKFRAQCEAVIGARRTTAALEVLWRLEEMEDVQALTSVLTPT